MAIKDQDRACAKCSKPFKSSKKDQKFCSFDCYFETKFDIGKMRIIVSEILASPINESYALTRNNRSDAKIIPTYQKVFIGEDEEAFWNKVKEWSLSQLETIRRYDKRFVLSVKYKTRSKSHSSMRTWVVE